MAHQKKETFPIWTEEDRLCGQCSVRLAVADDWLCQECRDVLESAWAKLTHSAPAYPATRAEKRDARVSLS